MKPHPAPPLMTVRGVSHATRPVYSHSLVLRRPHNPRQPGYHRLRACAPRGGALYRFVAGFVVEPAYEGLKNGVDLRVLQADTDGPGTTPPASRSGCACAAPCGPRSVPDHQRWDRRHGHGPLRGTHECIAVALALVPALAPVEITTQEELELTDFLLALSSAYASAWTQKPATPRRTPEP